MALFVLFLFGIMGTRLLALSKYWKVKMSDTSRKVVFDAISQIEPYDDLEKEHRADALAWVESNAPLFRITKPDVPPKHLVSYFVLIDTSRKKLLLVDHKKSGLWLPAGGHVELDEDPKSTVEREIVEELRIEAVFAPPTHELPLFVTVTVTVGSTAGHTDVSLWYVVEGDSNTEIDYDEGEFKGIRWYDFDEVLETDISRLDPHMHRFVRKLVAH
jgi:8-oxo-dGTP diphosphatase